LENETSNQRNPELIGLLVGLLITLLGVGQIVVPGLAGADMMAFGYALGFVGIMVVATGLLVTWTYGRRAAAWQRIMAGNDVLAHWHYTPDEWQRYAEAEFEQERSDKRALWTLTTVIIVVVSAAFLLIDPEAGRWVALVMVSLDALLAVLALLLPWLDYRRNMRAPGAALISSRGVCLNGRLHLWNLLGSRLRRVSLSEGSPAILSFLITYPSRTGRQSYTLRVPVPAGQEPAAQQVCERLHTLRAKE
jgi:hypothetical protein